MNNMTITEANQQFSRLIKLTDQEEIVKITKNGKVKYVIMTEGSYKNMNTKIEYGKVGNTVCCVEIFENVARIWKIEPDSFVMYETDKDALSMEGNIVSLDMERIKGKESSFKVKYWDDLEEETLESEKAMELLRKAPKSLPQYELSIKTKIKVWE